MADNIVSKTCWTCKTEKPLADFYKESIRPDGCSKRCRACATEARHRHEQSPAGEVTKQQRKERERRVREQNMTKAPTLMNKLCRGCHRVLGISNFRLKRNTVSGVQSRCRTCVSSVQRKRIRRYQKTTRAQRLRHKYNLSIAEFEQMCREQHDACAICLRPTPKLFVDHCHATGHIRGLLCRTCNTGLGFFRDNIQSLERAIKYLLQSQKENTRVVNLVRVHKRASNFALGVTSPD